MSGHTVPPRKSELLPICHWSCAPEGRRGSRVGWRERRKAENAKMLEGANASSSTPEGERKK